MQLSEDIKEVEDLEEPFPYIPKDLYEKLTEIFDIRKMITYVHTREELQGIQNVMSFLELKYKEQFEKGGIE